LLAPSHARCPGLPGHRFAGRARRPCLAAIGLADPYRSVQTLRPKGLSGRHKGIAPRGGAALDRKESYASTRALGRSGGSTAPAVGVCAQGQRHDRLLDDHDHPAPLEEVGRHDHPRWGSIRYDPHLQRSGSCQKTKAHPGHVATGSARKSEKRRDALTAAQKHDRHTSQGHDCPTGGCTREPHQATR
jgi:hypothetical protein